MSTIKFSFLRASRCRLHFNEFLIPGLFYRLMYDSFLKSQAISSKYLKTVSSIQFPFRKSYSRESCLAICFNRYLTPASEMQL